MATSRTARPQPSPSSQEQSGTRLRRKFFNLATGFDMHFFVLLMIILIVGLATLYSASHVYAFNYNDGDSFFYIRKQAIFAAMGLVAMLGISMVDYHVDVNGLSCTVNCENEELMPLVDKLVELLQAKELFTFTNNRSSEVFAVEEQKTQYNHPSYGIIRVRGNGIYNSSEDSFYFDLVYIVDAGSFGTYRVTLQLNRAMTAPVRDHKEEGAEIINPEPTTELKATLQTKELQGNKATHMQLQPMNSRE